MNHLAGQLPEDFKILTRGVEDFEDVRIFKESEERGEIKLFFGRERIDRHGLLVRPRHLNKAELRVVGSVAEKFRIDGDKRSVFDGFAESLQGGIGGNQGHGNRGFVAMWGGYSTLKVLR